MQCILHQTMDNKPLDAKIRQENISEILPYGVIILPTSKKPPLDQSSEMILLSVQTLLKMYMEIHIANLHMTMLLVKTSFKQHIIKIILLLEMALSLPLLLRMISKILNISDTQQLLGRRMEISNYRKVI